MARKKSDKRRASRQPVRGRSREWGERLSRLTTGWRAVGILWIAGLIAFAPTITFDFTGYDDDALIVNRLEQWQTDFSPLRFFTEPTLLNPDQTPFYRPLLMFSFWLDAQFSGGQPMGYHLSNLFWHLVAVWMLFFMLTGLFKERSPALMITLIFAVHPLNTQAVAWLPGRNDVLLGIAAFSSIALWLRWLKSRKTVYFAGHLLLFLAALFVKETAVALPLVAVLAWITIANAPAPRLFGWSLAGWLIAGSVWWMFRMQVFGGAATLKNVAVAGPFEILVGLSMYAVKAVVPLYLSPYPISRDMNLIWLIAAVLLLIMPGYWGFREKRLAWFGAGWFILWLLPTFVQGAEEVNFLEPRAYVALPGLWLVLTQIQWRKAPIPNPAGRVLITGLVLGFVVQTWTYAQAFANPASFWETMRRRSPESVFTYYGLGNWYMQKQDYAAAVEAYRQAVTIKPDYSRAWYNMGNAYFQMGDLEEAEAAYLRSLQIRPNFQKAQQNLAAVYFNRANQLRQRGRSGEAIAFYQKALQWHPGFIQAYNNLAVLLSEIGRHNQSLVLLKRALALDPNRPETHLNLAIVYFARNEFQRAARHADRALQLGAVVDSTFLQALSPYRQSFSTLPGPNRQNQ